ncbi:NAD(+) synthase [Agrobacterium sp. DKPNP3]|uniref:NAD(+) synthase n=1 Tax=Agrobacterium sp. DKPNP3 TaxID=3457323 RepID=UPI0040443651
MDVERKPVSFGPHVFDLDVEAETLRIVEALRGQLRSQRKRGLVLGLSGGIDSSVCAALAVKAVGQSNVCAIFMPEADSDPDSLHLGKAVATRFGLEGIVENIGPTLLAMGCYERRDAFIREIVPDYGVGWASKVVISSALQGGFSLSYLVVADPQGKQSKHRIPHAAYLGIVAASNMKQRTRKQIEYYHADRLNFAVLGTPNRLEYDQGFFVKNGDGAADVKPIAHLYKSQVYALARHLGVPDDVLSRPPTTDTYSLPQTQEEFYFSLSWDRMDLCLYGLNHDIPHHEIGAAAQLTPQEVEHVLADIVAKRRATRYLHQRPHLVEDIREIG